MPTRIDKPFRDPLLDQLLRQMAADPRTRHAKANVSGLSSATLKAWETGKTRRPQSVSIQMMYRVLGYELRPVKVV